MSDDELITSIRDLLRADHAYGYVSADSQLLHQAAARLTELREERENFHMDYRMRCDEQTKAAESRATAAENQAEENKVEWYAAVRDMRREATRADDAEAREAKLREALRRHTIYDVTGPWTPSEQTGCDQCGRRWARGVAERHAPDCLAALPLRVCPRPDGCQSVATCDSVGHCRYRFAAALQQPTEESQ